MIHVLSTCTVIMGKREEFGDMVKEITSVYEKHGAKLVGFWWTLGGEANEAVWIYAWENLKDYEKGQEAVWKDKSFPMEKFSSTVITYTDKILKSLPLTLVGARARAK